MVEREGRESIYYRLLRWGGRRGEMGCLLEREDRGRD